ncbi:MAG: hypothetical protein JWO02_3475, partial [Solirubrobacterales bacterium]|nr:hypothetical protein [Solirubrobacterales bacterium]
AAALLRAGGLDTEYLETYDAHHIDEAHVPAAVDRLAQTLRLQTPAG